MRASARITLFLVLSGIGALIACSDSAKPIGTGDKVVNDTAGEDAYSPPVPQPTVDSGDAGGYDSGDAGYMPALNTCSGCSCDPSKNYCFSGGIRSDVRVFPTSGGGFGEPDGAPTGPPPAPCTILDAGTLTNGCVPLPTACMTTPDCVCLLNALQPFYSCFLVCTPTPGFLEVYCPGGTGNSDY